MSYQPDYAVPPGETIQELLEINELTLEELSEQTGIDQEQLYDVVQQGRALTEGTVDKIAIILGVPKSFLMNLERNYRETLERITIKGRDKE